MRIVSAAVDGRGAKTSKARAMDATTTTRMSFMLSSLISGRDLRQAARLARRD